MQKITAIAVDDEPIALQVIKDHASKTPFLELKTTFFSATEALAYLQKDPVEVIFLDIHMPDLSGIDLAQILNPDTKVIFTTAYSEYAVKGFEIAAVDYLLKPIGFNRFLDACVKLQDRLQEKTGVKGAEEYLFVKDGYDYVRIDPSKLLYVESDDNYVTFYEDSKRAIVRMTLTETLENLPADKFMRVHKSYIISLAKIEKIERNSLTIAGRKIPLSIKYRESLIDRVNKI